MVQASSPVKVIQGKAHPDIYTLLLIVSIIALGTTIGLVLYNLMAPVPGTAGEPGGYALSFGELFQPLKELVGK